MKTEADYPSCACTLCAEEEKSQGNSGENSLAVAGLPAGPVGLDGVIGRESDPCMVDDFRGMVEESLAAVRTRLGDGLERLLPLIAHYPGGEEYYTQSSARSWGKVSRRQLEIMLKLLPGCKILAKRRYLAGESGEREALSDFDCAMFYIEHRNAVDRVVPSLAGYRSGIQSIGLDRVLVLKEPEIMAPARGEFPTIDALLRHILDFDCHRQHERFKCLLKSVLISVHGVYHGNVSLELVRRTFLDLYLVGASQRGKSFIVQQILQPMLGNVIGKPFATMAGKTEFNDDTVRAILQTCDDSCGFDGQRKQEDYAQMIKQLHSNDATRVNCKFKEPFNAHLLQFYANTLNCDPASLKLFPQLVDSVDGLRQRILALYVNPVQWEGFHNGSDGERRNHLQHRIRNELPAFIYHLLFEFEIPDELKGQSFLCKEFIHPRIARLNRDNTREGKFRLHLFEVLQKRQFTGTAGDLYRIMHKEYGASVIGYYGNPKSFGKLLTKLCRMCGDEFSAKKDSRSRTMVYTIKLNWEDFEEWEDFGDCAIEN
jgi:hypothetical protein